MALDCGCIHIGAHLKRHGFKEHKSLQPFGWLAQRGRVIKCLPAVVRYLPCTLLPRRSVQPCLLFKPLPESVHCFVNVTEFVPLDQQKHVHQRSWPKLPQSLRLIAYALAESASNCLRTCNADLQTWAHCSSRSPAPSGQPGYGALSQVAVASMSFVISQSLLSSAAFGPRFLP